jgi:hypothetical protein
VVFQFLHGALTICGLIAGLYFWRAWRMTRDRLFVFFAAAFWILALHWGIIGTTHEPIETRHYLYAIRLAAFGLIIIGIIDKNKSR